MKGIYGYEERLKNPYLSLIDWEYIILHPEAKLAIMTRYNTDIFFKKRIDEAKAIDSLFEQKFDQYFNPNKRSR